MCNGAYIQVFLFSFLSFLFSISLSFSIELFQNLQKCTKSFIVIRIQLRDSIRLAAWLVSHSCTQTKLLYQGLQKLKTDQSLTKIGCKHWKQISRKRFSFFQVLEVPIPSQDYAIKIWRTTFPNLANWEITEYYWKKLK